MKGNEIERKLEFYLLKDKPLHITCISNKFYNGKIIEINIVKKFLVLKENKLGETPILFEEIEDIEPFVENERI